MKTRMNLFNMKFHAFHGVLPQESVIGSEFEVNLRIEADLSEACASDDVRKTLNYAEVYDLVKEEMQIPSQLLEHVAGRIYRKLMEQYPAISTLEVRVAKMHPPVNGEMEKAEIVIGGDC